MNVGELPMVLFTVLSQMSVGAFVMLGLVQTFGSIRNSSKSVDRLADPALLVIGPTLVLGLIASMFHMNYPLNTINVIRHVGTSWLSREIVFGVAFAGLGFLFAIMQFFKLANPRVRQALALVTALFGVGLVVCQVMIYFSTETVPAWNHAATWVQFFGTTVLMGALMVAFAFSVIARQRNAYFSSLSPERQAGLDEAAKRGEPSVADTGIRARVTQLVGAHRRDDSATNAEVNRVLVTSIRAMVLLAVVAAAAIIVVMPTYIASFGEMGHVGEQAAAHYNTAFTAVRFVLLAVGAFVFGVLSFFESGREPIRFDRLMICLTVAFVLCIIGEFMGRTTFYEMLIRVGI